ncbi:MAG: biotin transporter BioY [Lachnospiraceae bacterium]|nr:biotin transporter BioY [Lachnospiraceae bacterium]
MKTLTNPKTRDLTLVGMTAAALCILGPLSIPIPISPTPISLITMVMYLSIFILGAKKSALSVLIYILVGATGIPVFSNFSGGISKLFGPTGGYIIGYIPMVYLAGLFIDKHKDSLKMYIFGLMLGTLALYILGSLYLAFQASIDFEQAVAIGVLPFIPLDMVKLIASVFMGPLIKKQLKKARLL